MARGRGKGLRRWHAMAVSGNRMGTLCVFAGDKPGNSLLQTPLRNQPSAPGSVLRPSREDGVAPRIEIQRHYFGKPIPAQIEALAPAEALEEVQLLVGHFEQLAVELAVERCIREQKDRRTGVHDAVCVFPKIVG